MRELPPMHQRWGLQPPRRAEKAHRRWLRWFYRGSKSALNMFMRSFAARHAYDTRALLLLAPGCVRTDMGGPEARLNIEESIPNLQAINPRALAETGEGRRQSWWRSSAAFEQREQLMN